MGLSPPSPLKISRKEEERVYCNPFQGNICALSSYVMRPSSKGGFLVILWLLCSTVGWPATVDAAGGVRGEGMMNARFMRQGCHVKKYSVKIMRANYAPNMYLYYCTVPKVSISNCFPLFMATLNFWTDQLLLSARETDHPAAEQQQKVTDQVGNDICRSLTAGGRTHLSLFGSIPPPR